MPFVREASSGLHVDDSQIAQLPMGNTRETILIPMDSTAALNSQFTATIRERNVRILAIRPVFTMSALTGTTGTFTSGPALLPMPYWFSRIELLIDSKIVDTCYPDVTHSITNLMKSD